MQTVIDKLFYFKAANKNNSCI